MGKLKTPDVTFWSIRVGDVRLGCGALKKLDSEYSEIKSMRTPASLRRRGAGRAILQHIIAVARERGYKRLSLETGSPSAFVPARRLYESFGFGYCEPFCLRNVRFLARTNRLRAKFLSLDECLLTGR